MVSGGVAKARTQDVVKADHCDILGEAQSALDLRPKKRNDIYHTVFSYVS
jgi:hypothetical protein